MHEGRPLEEGELHIRPRLAETLQLLAENGSSDPFYFGQLGENLIREVQERGGIITMEDLNNYR